MTARALDNGGIALEDERLVIEFLEMPSETDVSQRHAAWFALLLWLDGRRYTLRATRSDAGLQYKPEKSDERISAANSAANSVDKLAAWIEQF